jgi:hypothetical protein
MLSCKAPALGASAISSGVPGDEFASGVGRGLSGMTFLPHQEARMTSGAAVITSVNAMRSSIFARSTSTSVWRATFSVIFPKYSREKVRLKCLSRFSCNFVMNYRVSDTFIADSAPYFLLYGMYNSHVSYCNLISATSAKGYRYMSWKSDLQKLIRKTPSADIKYTIINIMRSNAEDRPTARSASRAKAHHGRSADFARQCYYN